MSQEGGDRNPSRPCAVSEDEGWLFRVDCRDVTTVTHSLSFRERTKPQAAGLTPGLAGPRANRTSATAIPRRRLKKVDICWALAGRLLGICWGFADGLSSQVGLAEAHWARKTKRPRLRLESWDAVEQSHPGTARGKSRCRLGFR